MKCFIRIWNQKVGENEVSARGEGISEREN